MKRHSLLVVLCIVSTCLFAGVSLLAQDSITVTVSATGPADTPLLTLGKPLFTVQESGKARTITTFVGPETKPAAPPRLQPNEFSNLPDFRETSGAVFVVLDTIHTRHIDEGDTRQEILTFMAKAAQARHAVTLCILGDKGLHVVHDYRTGSDVLLAALAKTGLGGMKGAAPPPGVNEAEVTADAARLNSFNIAEQSNPTPPNKLMRSNIDLSLVMFEDIAFAAYGLPGRKLLVWVTNAVPFDLDSKTMQFKSPLVTTHGVVAGGSTATVSGAIHGGPVGGPAVSGSKEALTSDEIKRLMPMWRHSMRALFDAGVAIYPVEARGSWSSVSNTFTQATMKELAVLTGGKDFSGSNDPFPGILQVSNGNTAGYELGFMGDAAASPDFHRLEVTVGQPSVQVSHPAGYFSYEGTPKSRAAEEIGVAMGSPLESTGIRFKLTVTGIEEGSGGKKKVNLFISLPGNDGLLNEATGEVDVGFLAATTNAKGEKVVNMNEGAGGKFPPDAVAHIKELGFELERSFDTSPGEYTVRFLVRDNQTGRMGDIFFPLNVK